MFFCVRIFGHNRQFLHVEASVLKFFDSLRGFFMRVVDGYDDIVIGHGLFLSSLSLSCRQRARIWRALPVRGLQRALPDPPCEQPATQCQKSEQGDQGSGLAVFGNVAGDVAACIRAGGGGVTTSAISTSAPVGW